MEMESLRFAVKCSVTRKRQESGSSGRMNTPFASVIVSKPDVKVLAAPVPNWRDNLLTPSALMKPSRVCRKVKATPSESGAELPLASRPLSARA